MKHKGDSWNESSVHTDAETGRSIRRLTSVGLWNEKPTYHTNTTFTADSESLIFARAHEGRTAMMKCHLPTGDLTQLTDPVDGVGSPWGVHKIDGESEYFDGKGISGILACVAPKSRRVVFGVGRSIRAVHLDTFEEMVLLEDFGPEWVDGALSIDPSETHALLPLTPAHPDVLAGKAMTKSYMESFADGGMVTRYVEIPLAGGESRIVFEDEGMGCAHCPHCPNDDDLVLIDRDRAPLFWGGGDHGASTRCWTLRLSTGELTELRPRNNQRFQVHAAWTWNGEHVLYHAFMRDGGYYIGITHKTGHVLHEYELPEAGAYGHVSAAPDRPAIILDGNVTENKLTWLYYDQETPSFETIATHDTEWGCMPGQYTDPHPQADPTGRYIAYHVAKDKRSDIYAVTV